ncbi:uncharacterized protein LOC120258441 isoform X3 [Dioscorea cayenensis subsp. rotundata]|uniref:Uncharacterized protein LOC120258441 isoform X3 n=1 Tax=Dioscorea cayennensis subsp. rotundata TaxID=55577 RepID=A0AB40B3B3_DIOCR|nr:uncharacterized protein LOC120258441 isoform X3 [Dioscorea cayenensis subsp. rotundata]
MPGTIHVFVLDLMDLPFDGSPLILKLAMGKREYQTVCKGECSFPVMSLRENLVLMLHDNEGNELSRTELPTMSVVEKGIWDDLFPLKGGGHVHMRVQFSLNEEERLRIRHMRETVVRKKQSELLKGQETGLLGSYPTTQLFSEGTKIEKTEQTDPGVCGGTLSLQEFRESSAQAFKQYDPHHTELSKKEIGISDKQDVSSVEVSNSSLSNELNEWWKLSSEQMIPTKPEQLATTYAGNITEDDQILETRRKGFHRRSLSSNMKKMITAFETILYQGWEPSFSPKLREYSGPNNIKYVKVPQILTKSFSAGMLSDIKSIQNPAVHRSIVEKKGEKSQLYSDSGKSQELANDIILYDTKTANYALEPMETERAFSIRGMVENSNDDIHLSDKKKIWQREKCYMSYLYIMFNLVLARIKAHLLLRLWRGMDRLILELQMRMCYYQDTLIVEDVVLQALLVAYQDIFASLVGANN